MNKMPVTVLQRLLHILVIHFTIIDGVLLSALKFCNRTARFESLAKLSTTYIEN